MKELTNVSREIAKLQKRQFHLLANERKAHAQRIVQIDAILGQQEPVKAAKVVKRHKRVKHARFGRGQLRDAFVGVLKDAQTPMHYRDVHTTLTAKAGFEKLTQSGVQNDLYSLAARTEKTNIRKAGKGKFEYAAPVVAPVTVPA